MNVFKKLLVLAVISMCTFFLYRLCSNFEGGVERPPEPRNSKRSGEGNGGQYTPTPLAKDIPAPLVKDTPAPLAKSNATNDQPKEDNVTGTCHKPGSSRININDKHLYSAVNLDNYSEV